MFDRFTPDAQSAVVESQEVARRLGYPRIQVEHLRAAVDGVDLSGATGEHAVLERLGLGELDQDLAEPPPPIPFDDDVKQVLTDALALAGDGPVGLPHLSEALARS